MKRTSSFNAMLSALRVTANLRLFITAAVLMLTMAACFGLSEADEHYNRGVNLLEHSAQDRYDNALTDMDRVVEIDPTYAKAYLVRAKANAKLGREAQSQSDIDRAVALGIARAEAETSVGGPAPST